MRKLARIVEIEEIHPHTNADALELAMIGGWQVVVKKGEFEDGDLAVYFEIDSWIPDTIAPWLTKPGQFPKRYNDVEGQRLKTIKLRGEVSQGLLMALDNFYHLIPTDFIVINGDVTHFLGIQKWEPVIPAQLVGVSRGNFPSFLRKTDQERFQNLMGRIKSDLWQKTPWEVTTKMDGSSMTVYWKDEETFGVCSRNLNLKLDQETGNAFIDMEKTLQIIEKLSLFGRPLAIQGELCGPGIQENNEELTTTQFFIYDLFDITSGCYFHPTQRLTVLSAMGLDMYHVPILYSSVTLEGLGLKDADSFLEFADGPSFNPKKKREGVVFKSFDGSNSFKAVSNQYLLKHGNR